MAYGKIKADSIIYDNSGSDVEKTIASLAAAAPTASPTFTGDITLTGAAANVVFDASDNALEFADNAKAVFGAGPDLTIQHNGSNSFIEDSGTGSLYLDSNHIIFRKYNTAEVLAQFIGDGSVELYEDNVKKFETTTAGVTVTGSVTDDKGNVRSIPAKDQGGASEYTLIASDAGKTILRYGGGLTIPNSVMATGDAVTIINASGSDITLTQGSSFTLYNTADASTGNRTLAGRGMATIWFPGSSSGYISGSGLS